MSDQQKNHQKKRLNIPAYVAAGLMIVSVILPWVTAENSQLTYIGIDKSGLVALFIAGIAIFFLLIRFKWVILAGIFNLFLFVYEWLYIFLKGNKYEFINMGNIELHRAEIAYGLWLLLLGSVLLILFTLKPVLKKKKVSDSNQNNTDN